MTDERPKFDLEFVASPIDYALACLLLYARPLRLLRLMLILFVVVVVVGNGTALVLRAGHEGVSGRGITGFDSFDVGFPVVFGLLVPTIQAAIVLVGVALRPRAKRALTMHVTEDGILAANSLAQTTYKWAGAVRLYHIGSRAYVALQSGISVLLSRGGLRDPGEWPALLAFVRSKISKN